MRSTCVIDFKCTIQYCYLQEQHYVADFWKVLILHKWNFISLDSQMGNFLIVFNIFKEMSVCLLRCLQCLYYSTCSRYTAISKALEFILQLQKLLSHSVVSSWAIKHMHAVLHPFINQPLNCSISMFRFSFKENIQRDVKIDSQSECWKYTLNICLYDWKKSQRWCLK